MQQERTSVSFDWAIKYMLRNKADCFCLFFIALGVFTRVWLYVAQSGLFLDEAYLATSIYHSSFKDVLTGSLPYGQVAPLGFILSVKLLALVFGDSEYVLRFIPFVSGILLLPVAYIFAKREFGAKFACIFLFFLCISDSLLFFTFQFKQYSSEAFIAMLYLCLFSLFRNKIKLSGNIPWFFIVLAPILTLFGNSPIFVLCGIFFTILYEQNKNILLFLRKNCIKFFAIVLACLAYYILYLSQINAVNNNLMDNLWNPYYLPKEFSKIPAYLQGYVLPLIGNYFTVITSSIYINTLFFTVCFCIGNFFLLRDKKHIFAAITVTLCILLFLYIVRLYPLGIPLDKGTRRFYAVGIRLLIYFIPLSLIPISLCLEKLWNFFLAKKLAKYNLAVSLFAFCAIAGFAVYINGKGIIKGVGFYEEKSIIEKMNYFQSENSIIFMNKGAEPVYLYDQNRNKESREYYILDDALPQLTGIAKKEIFAIKDVDSISQIFNLANNAQKEFLIFFFIATDNWTMWQSQMIFKFLQENYPQKFLNFDSGYGAVGVFVDLKKDVTPLQ